MLRVIQNISLFVYLKTLAIQIRGYLISQYINHPVRVTAQEICSGSRLDLEAGSCFRLVASNLLRYGSIFVTRLQVL